MSGSCCDFQVEETAESAEQVPPAVALKTNLKAGPLIIVTQFNCFIISGIKFKPITFIR